MYFTIYKTTNLINQKIYIGMHITDNLDDGYLGSGKLLIQAIKKYGKENFSKEILFVLSNEDEMRAKEKELVTEDFCNRSDTYNLCDGGKGGFSYINRSGIAKFRGKRHKASTRELLSEKAKGNQNSLGYRHSEDTKRIIGEKSRLANKGKRKAHSEETKKKIAQTMLDKLANTEHRSIMVNRMLDARQYKPAQSNETKAKIAKSVKNSWTLRSRPIRDWVSIQFDLDNGLPRSEIYKKYGITRNVLDHAFKMQYINRTVRGSYSGNT